MRYLADVVTLRLDTERCRGCWQCIDVCPRAVFRRHGGVVVIADRDRCIECGACALNCPFGALSVEAGVGCAAAVIGGMLRGGEPECGSGACCCCDAQGDNGTGNGRPGGGATQ